MESADISAARTTIALTATVYSATTSLTYTARGPSTVAAGTSIVTITVGGGQGTTVTSTVTVTGTAVYTTVTTIVATASTTTTVSATLSRTSF